ncbi:hypothetical protein [Scandinavium sp.]|uniref:primase 1D-like protein n=1 Tax=Scandinavium sp. TaxID=2830653 RepID=UPI00289DA137|nr:hypothetical protein [Scandinavium sp.]
MNERISGHIKINRHPILWVCDLMNAYQRWNVLTLNAELTFSKYRYKPHSFEDDREIFKIPIRALDRSSLFDMLIDLEDGQELSLNSNIHDYNNEYYLPLIDFGGKDSKSLEYSFREFCSYWNMEFQIYSSGRSYHAYGNRLLTYSEWIKFMGSLLLLNIPGSSKIIDDRWVGHRILAGYSSLRWSKNTSQYKKYPTHVGVLNSLGFHDGQSNGSTFNLLY